MSCPQVTGIHLVGSIPLPTTDEVFTTLSKTLPQRLKRLPDGETGERHYFARWQARVLSTQVPLVLNERACGFLGIEHEAGVQGSFEGLEIRTEYDDYAIESYLRFVELRKKRVVEDKVRFQVCLPTPLNVLMLVREELRKEFEPLYEKAMMRSVQRIQEVIPNEDLAIQWDVVFEIAILEGSDGYGNLNKVWFEKPYLEGILKRIGRCVDHVEEGVEVGLHLCYGEYLRSSFVGYSLTGTGDSGRRHFVEPKDTGLLVDLASQLLDRSSRRVDFVHMPVPKNRTDVSYMEPLRALNPHVDGGLELILGLVHINDLEGTKERIQAASQVLPFFRISSECGLGRVTPTELQSILEICAEVTNPRT